MIAGTIKRFAALPPEPDNVLLEKFGEYVDLWLKANLVPLSPDVDSSFDTWLAKTNYPEWRKQELREANESFREIWDDPRNLDVNSFMKDEGYAADEFKHARGINSRTDAYKMAVGPLFKLIEEEVFKLPEFIKKVPVAERAKYIMDRLYREGATYIATDYTSFEALFTRKFMEVCEFKLYKYMTQALPQAADFKRHMDEVLAGHNKCTFKHFIVKVWATRMSGEMCTSLGNGFSNLMLMNFALEFVGSKGVKVVEGDDGLCRVDGTVPTPELFEKLGMKIKLEKHIDISRASFCGLVFDPEECTIVADPKKVLASFGWTSSRYVKSGSKALKQLLRVKALSFAHQYPGCPVISSLAHYALRNTRDVRYIPRRILESIAWWDRANIIPLVKFGNRNDVGVHAFTDEPPRQEPGLRTRVLVEEVFGIPIQAQIAIEKMLDDKEDLEPFECPLVDFPSAWTDYFSWYVLEVPDGTALNYPGELWQKRAGHVKEWEFT